MNWKFWERIKENFSTARNLEDIYKKYPILKATRIHSDAIESYALFESAKWQKYYSFAFIILTVALVIITGIYAGGVFQSNKIMSSQFEIENTPQLEILSLVDDSNLGIIYTLTLKNIGKTKIMIEDANLTQIRSKISDQTTLNLRKKIEIFPGMEKSINFLDLEEKFDKSETMMLVEIEYSGKGSDSKERLPRTFYRYEGGSFHSLN